MLAPSGAGPQRLVTPIQLVQLQGHRRPTLGTREDAAQLSSIRDGAMSAKTVRRASMQRNSFGFFRKPLTFAAFCGGMPIASAMGTRSVRRR